jgi:hypothetical protein
MMPISGMTISNEPRHCLAGFRNVVGGGHLARPERHLR